MRLRPRKVKVPWSLVYNATGVPTSPWGVTVSVASILRKTYFHCQLEGGILRLCPWGHFHGGLTERGMPEGKWHNPMSLSPEPNMN